MKKLLSVLTLLILVSSVSFGQASDAYKPGSITVSGGIGLLGDGLPIYLAGEYGFNENIGIGGFFGYYSYDYTGFWELSWTKIGAYAVYHYDLLKMENLDTYAKAGLAYGIASWNWKGDGDSGTEPSVSAIGYDAAVGAYYYLSSNLGVNVELGYGDLGLIKAGVTYRL